MQGVVKAIVMLNRVVVMVVLDHECTRHRRVMNERDSLSKHFLLTLVFCLFPTAWVSVRVDDDVDDDNDGDCFCALTIHI
jgi:LytS/YehU family sensor histidine kinase